MATVNPKIPSNVVAPSESNRTPVRKKKPANNPALAGRFTQAYKNHMAKQKKDNPKDSPAMEAAERAKGIKT